MMCSRRWRILACVPIREVATMPSMAKQKPKAGEPDDAQKPISYRPSAEVATAMRTYRDRFKVKPAKSAIIERALREFFKAEGIEIEVNGDGDQ